MILPRQWQVPLHLPLDRVELSLFLAERNLRIFYDLDQHVRSRYSLVPLHPQLSLQISGIIFNRAFRSSIALVVGRATAMFVSFESSPSAGPPALGIARRLPTLSRILLANSYDLLTVDVLSSF